MKYLKCLVFLTLFSCKDKANETCTQPEQKKEDGFVMYKASEMATLMEKMYAENQTLKEKIVSGEKTGNFPEYFLEIHKAEMTKGKERDQFFMENGEIFLKEQSEIYQTNSKKEFNEMVDACIKCHETKCQGPIDRIKKLYIKSKK